MRGGKRPGAGRKRHVPNKASAAREQEVQATGLTPRDIMLAAMRQLWTLAEKHKRNRKLNEHYVRAQQPLQRTWHRTFTLEFQALCQRRLNYQKRLSSRSSAGCRLDQPRKNLKGRNTARCRRKSRPEVSGERTSSYLMLATMPGLANTI